MSKNNAGPQITTGTRRDHVHTYRKRSTWTDKTDGHRHRLMKTEGGSIKQIGRADGHDHPTH